MNKPNNPKCDICFVKNNPLRCWACKYKTEEWKSKNLKPVLFYEEYDLYKPKSESEE